MSGGAGGGTQGFACVESDVGMCIFYPIPKPFSIFYIYYYNYTMKQIIYVSVFISNFNAGCRMRNIKKIVYEDGTTLTYTDGPPMYITIKYTDTTTPIVIHTPFRFEFPNNIQDTDPCANCSNKGKGACLCALPSMRNPVMV